MYQNLDLLVNSKYNGKFYLVISVYKQNVLEIFPAALYIIYRIHAYRLIGKNSLTYRRYRKLY